jgi:5,10-methenyltetrahydrofolate synthetase
MNEKKILRSNLDEIKGIKKLSIENIKIINNFIKNKIVCTYIHTDSEVDITNDLIGYKQLITSYLVSSDIELCLYKEPFIKNALNILEPENPIKIKEVDVFLVPGVAFTASGKRLGRGGGYYDKLLSKYPDTLKIGITFNERIMQDLPTESHDISMDYVFTNDKYYKSEI